MEQARLTRSVLSGALPPGLILNSSGVLSGTPTNPGTYSFTVQEQDAQYATGSKALSVLISGPLSITGPASLPSGTVGSAYSQVTFTASGGAGFYTWSATGLPNGLSFSAAGVLSGTPTTAGNYAPQFTVTDASKTTVTVSRSLTIVGALSITGPASLPSGTVGSVYSSVTFTATGGTGVYSWSATGLPNGLSVSAAGVLSGTRRPRAAILHNLRSPTRPITIATVSRSLTINGTLSITGPASLPAGTVGSAYNSVTFAATGGTGVYTWSATGLPSGLSLSTAGALSGTPTTAGSYTPQFTPVTDSSNSIATVSRSITINGTQLSIAGPISLPPGTVGAAYNPVTFTASGGTGVYTWSATGLPSGLSFSVGGVLSGTPTTAAGCTPQFTVTDSANSTASVSHPLTVNGSLNITGPASLPAGTVGSAYNPVTFTATGGIGVYAWSATGLPSGLSFSAGGVLSGTPTTAGSYTPQFTVTDSSNKTASISLTITIAAASPS